MLAAHVLWLPFCRLPVCLAAAPSLCLLALSSDALYRAVLRCAAPCCTLLHRAAPLSALLPCGALQRSSAPVAAPCGALGRPFAPCYALLFSDTLVSLNSLDSLLTFSLTLTVSLTDSLLALSLRCRSAPFCAVRVVLRRAAPCCALWSALPRPAAPCDAPALLCAALRRSLPAQICRHLSAFASRCLTLPLPLSACLPPSASASLSTSAYLSTSASAVLSTSDTHTLSATLSACLSLPLCAARSARSSAALSAAPCLPLCLLSLYLPLTAPTAARDHRCLARRSPDVCSPDLCSPNRRSSARCS